MRFISQSGDEAPAQQPAVVLVVGDMAMPEASPRRAQQPAGTISATGSAMAAASRGKGPRPACPESPAAMNVRSRRRLWPACW
jgi:hypothetical protein